MKSSLNKANLDRDLLMVKWTPLRSVARFMRHFLLGWGGGGGGGAFIGIDHLLALFLIVIIHSFFSLSSLFLIDLCMLNTNLKV